jgi:peptidoglycan/LPS O-acetylase OafA/YrhL
VKHQYVTLDGLRGIAAMAVMCFHRRDWFEHAGIQHAPLAVDFFFMLSGFVIAHAYGRRLTQRNSFRPFMRDRIIRLHPMLIAGGVLAFLIAMLDARAGRDVAMNSSWLTFAASLIPFPAFWANADSAFPWNIAIWSLFWELVVNVLYAASARWLTNSVLIAIVALCVPCMFGASWAFGGFQVGFPQDTVLLLFGLPRVCASFFLGVLVQRLHVAHPITALPRGSGEVCAALLLLTFLTWSPLAGYSWLYYPVIAYGFYPILLLLAAGATSSFPKLALVLGVISYPLYIIHEPMLKAVSGLLTILHLSTGKPDALEAILRLCLIPAIAYVVLKVYDEPIRRWLRRKCSSGQLHTVEPGKGRP